MDETRQTETEIRERLESFRAFQGRFDYWLFEYGPLLVIGQFSATGLTVILVVLYNMLHPNPQLITWALGAIYGGVLLILFAESLSVRSFLKRIPEAFGRLWERGAISKSQPGNQTAEKFTSFLREFEDKLNDRQRLWLGVPLALLGLLFFWSTGHFPYTLGRWSDGSDLVTILVTTIVNTVALFGPAVIVGYATGVGIWKSIVTGLYVRRFSRSFDLDIQPSHPDKAGGLKPLGDLVLSMAAILIIASLGLSGLTIYAQYIGFIYTAVYSRMFLGIVFALSLIAFFLPLLSTHNRMVAARTQVQPLLTRITRRIAELEKSARADLTKMNHRTRREILDEIDVLAELHRRNARVPAWPFDRDIFIRFVIPQLFSLLSLVGAAEPIIKLIRSLSPP